MAIDCTKNTLEVGLTKLGDILGVGGKGDVMSDPQISGWVVGGDENAQFPERVNVRAEEGLGEGDKFSFGESVLQQNKRVGWQT